MSSMSKSLFAWNPEFYVVLLAIMICNECWKMGIDFC